MEWERAKTILIMIFLLLNAGLFSMSMYLDKKDKMTQDDISAIKNILAENNISLECELPTENKPLRYLNLEVSDWDYNYIKDTFFTEATDVTRTYEEGGLIYESLQTGVSVEVTNVYGGGSSQLIYTSPSTGIMGMDAGVYIKLLGERFEDFDLVRVTSDNGRETFLYNEGLKNGLLFSSWVQIAIYDEYVSINAEKLDFVSYVEGNSHDIFRADEALLAFMHYKNSQLAGRVVIEDIHLGYGVEGNRWERSQKAKPYYRIFISGSSSPVYVDAVMNTVIVNGEEAK